MTYNSILGLLLHCVPEWSASKGGEMHIVTEGGGCNAVEEVGGGNEYSC